MLLCVYFPPDSPDYVFLEFISTVQRLVHHHPEYDIIIAGDFNLPDVDWYTIDALSLVSSQFCDFIFTYNLTYVMNNTNAKGNILDLVILNCPERFVDISIDNKSIGCGLSDHYFIVVELLIVNEAVSRLNQNNASYCFCFKKFDFKEVDSYFLDQDFSTLLNSNNVELSWSFLKGVLFDACDTLIPKKHFQPSRYPVWFSSDIRHSINCIKTIQRRIQKKPSAALVQKLKDKEKELSEMISNCKLDHQRSIVSQFYTNPSKLYSHLRKMSKRKSKPNVIIDNGIIVSDSKENATLFNNFFHSTFIYIIIYRFIRLYTEAKVSMGFIIHTERRSREVDKCHRNRTEVYNALVPCKCAGKRTTNQIICL